MLLYHFTKFETLPAITRDGLIPSEDDPLMPMIGGNKVVWLTEATSTSLSERDRVRMLERTGEPVTEWLPDCPARVTVRIPAHDRKLVRYVPWLRKHGRQL